MTSRTTAWEWRSQALVEGTPESGAGAWPFRSYTCNFCSRAFRSAQALGGHMNVHRHDRARLLRPPSTAAAATILFPSSPSSPCADDAPLLGRPVVSAKSLLGPDRAVRDLCLLKSCVGGGGGGGREGNVDRPVVEVLDLELRLWW